MNIDDIKVKLTPELETEITDYLCTQIDTAIKDRANQETKWSKWIDQYEEKLPLKKNFPWENASNISVPVTPIAVETIHAREVNTILGVRPYIHIKAKKKGVNPDSLRSLERFLDEIFRTVISGYDICSQWFMEKCKMGSGFVKVYWNYDKKKIRKGEGYEFQVTDNASVDVITIEDLIFPSNAKSVEQSFWVAHRTRVNWNTLRRKEKLGIYKNIDRIKSFYTQASDKASKNVDIEKQKKELEGIQETSPEILRDYELYEVQLGYDIDNDGYDEYLIATIELKSRTLIRIIHYPYNHGKRPFIKNDFMKRTGRIYSKGICEMSEHIQDAINTVFNQTIDNATVANVKCFKGRKTAKRDIGKVYPGKVFWLDDPTDLQEFLLGEIHQSSFLIHNLLRDYHERRTKVTDYTLGRESSLIKSRATATGTLALLGESGRHFDLILNNTRESMVELAYQIIELYAQYRPDKIFEVTGEKGVIEEIGLPTMGNVRDEYEFYCAATSLAVNKEIEKQTNLVLIQQLSVVFRQILQLFMMISSQQVQLPDDIKKYVMDMIKSYHRMAEDMVRSFEKVDIESYIPELPEMVKQAFGVAPSEAQPDELSQFLGGLLGTRGTETGVVGTPEESSMGTV